MAFPDPQFSSTSTTIDALIAGHNPEPVYRNDLTLLSGESVVRGELLGVQDASTVPTTGTAGGGNTGDGTMTAVAAGGDDLIPGVYTARCIEAITNLGDFEVIDPQGDQIGVAITGTAFTSSHLDFTINDGAADYIVGDTFTITVTGSGKLLSSLAAAEDGSQNPKYIAAATVDATAGDAGCVVFAAGMFNSDAMTFGAGHTAASTKEGLQLLGIHLRTNTAV